MSRARIRTIKPEMWHSRDFRSLTAIGKLAFITLISNADDEGRLATDPDHLADVYMGVPQEAERVREAFVTMAQRRMIEAYSIAGIDYVVVSNFAVHQVINRPTPSSLPPPSEPKFSESSVTSHRKRTEGSVTTHAGLDRKGSDRKGKEGIRSEGKREKTGASAADSLSTALVVAPQSGLTDDEMALVEHHAKVTGKTGTVLIEPSDLKLLRDARTVYSDQDLMDAIVGLDHSPFNRGENDNGTPYQGWRHLLSSEAKHWRQIDPTKIEQLRGLGRKPRRAIGRKGREAQTSSEHLEELADQLRAEEATKAQVIEKEPPPGPPTGERVEAVVVTENNGEAAEEPTVDRAEAARRFRELLRPWRATTGASMATGEPEPGS